MNKRLQRPPDTAMIGGVCAGIADYFGVDPTWIRLLAVLLIFASGFGLVAYVVAWVVIPRGALAQPTDPSSVPQPIASASSSAAGTRNMAIIPGLILVIAGMAFLFDNLFWWFDWDYVWPLLLVGAGVLMIIHSLKPTIAARREQTAGIVEVNDASR